MLVMEHPGAIRCAGVEVDDHYSTQLIVPECTSALPAQPSYLPILLSLILSCYLLSTYVRSISWAGLREREGGLSSSGCGQHSSSARVCRQKKQRSGTPMSAQQGGHLATFDLESRSRQA